MFDYTVFIGRFQPIHNGHLKVIKQALTQSDRLIILVGSSNRARDIRNPFSYAERVEMINLCLTEQERARIFCVPLPDFMYQDTAWVENVQRLVDSIVDPKKQNTTEANIALIGHAKDATGFFLKLFPQWSSVPVIDPTETNATDIRDLLLSRSVGYFEKVSNLVPPKVAIYLYNWRKSNLDNVVKLTEEYEHVINYKKQFAGLKYPPIHHTVDSVIIQSGHVLLVERGAMPGKGLYALPGGFLKPHMFLLDGALEEVYQETKLDVPEKVLRGSLKDTKTFDDPYRSTRGRTITNSFFFKLEDRKNLPKVKTKQSINPNDEDDAKKAFWMPLSQLACEHMFEDHWFQIQYFKDRDRLAS